MNEPKIEFLFNYGRGWHSKNVYGTGGIAPTILTGSHGLGTAIMMEEEDGGGKLQIPTKG